MILTVGSVPGYSRRRAGGGGEGVEASHANKNNICMTYVKRYSDSVSVLNKQFYNVGKTLSPTRCEVGQHLRYATAVSATLLGTMHFDPLTQKHKTCLCCKNCSASILYCM